MPDATNSAQVLRNEAERCRRWARETKNAEAGRKLLDVATQFEEEAAALETSGKGQQYPDE
jgi:hypothetical protein